MKDGTGTGAEGLATDGAMGALLRPTMDADGALADLAPCGTGQVRAPYLVRIHGCLLQVAHTGFSMDPLIC